MIEQEFVKYEEALALKKLGFDEPCMSSRDMNNTEGLIQVPTYAQAFRFFRYCYWYYVSISPTIDLGNIDFTIEINQFFQEDRYFGEGDNEEYFPWGLYLLHTERLDSYPEAEQACLKKLIEIAKTK